MIGKCFECGTATVLIQGMCRRCRALYYGDQEARDEALDEAREDHLIEIGEGDE